jgi:hypothetical protein
MTSFRLTWPEADAARVVAGWQAWAPEGPRELAASLLVTASADVDEPLVPSVFGSLISDGSDGAELLEDLVDRVGTDPATAERRHGTHRDTKRHLATLGADRGDAHEYSRSEFFSRSLPPDAIAALVKHLGAARVPGEARELDFSPWGGAYGDVAGDATAFAHRDERFLLKQTAFVEAADAAHGRGWLQRSFELARPWGSGHVYPNFPDPDLEDPSRAYYAANLPRLRRVKAAYDPEGRFRPA